MANDPVIGFQFFDKRYDAHPAATGWTQQRINFINLSDYLGSAFGRHRDLIIFHDRGEES
jgi:hypothetical protein